jgi:hypothetical protein
MSERGPLDFDDDDREPARRDPARSEPPRRPSGRRPAAAPMRSYVWVVGIAALVLVLVLLATTIQHGTDQGARGLPAGEPMPPFAVPTATGELDGDANLAEHADEGQAGRVPACEVRGPDVLNGCALRDAGPVVLAFFTIRNRECVDQIDVLNRARARLPGVQLAAIAIRGDRGDLRALVGDHGWTIPVGFDRDGALSNAFHVQVCPQITFARPGGRVVETTFGTISERDLVVKARELSGT